MRILAIILPALMLTACSGDQEEALPTEPGQITIVQGEKASDGVSPLIGYNVKGEYQVQFAPDGEEDATTRMVGAAAVSRSAPYSAIAQRLAQQSLGKSYLVKCSPCHDNYANGVIGPSLLGKNADEIYDMIAKYRNNQEENNLMKVFVDKMEDSEIRDMAIRIADFNEMMQKRAEEE
jgi:cytochrome c553